MSAPLLFAPQASRMFGERVAAALGIELAPLEEREFDFGEHKARPLVSVRDGHAYVIQCLAGDHDSSANDRLCRLLFLVATLKDCGAARVTACIPYLAYARKDRRTKERDPVTQRYVAQLLEAAGTDHLLTLEVHNLAAFENAFRCPVDHLEFAPLLAGRLGRDPAARPTVVVSPDIGGAKRAQRLREILAARSGEEVGLAFLEKRRSSGVVSGDRLVGEVAGSRAVIVDDLVSSGTTIVRAVNECRRAGAARVEAAAAHGVFSAESARILAEHSPDRLLVSDSILPVRLDDEGWRSRLEVLPASSMFAEAIRRLESGGSVVELRELEPRRAVTPAAEPR
ncbi:MAG TPA: ribose-phosphate diphosphokinase [Steroidobacteraceae bacterium]|nr:ribose-phosphate diphosphokinase [Steroidobacteraceae bacterium]